MCLQSSSITGPIISLISSSSDFRSSHVTLSQIKGSKLQDMLHRSNISDTFLSWPHTAHPASASLEGCVSSENLLIIL